jgi:hypothetical protein
VIRAWLMGLVRPVDGIMTAARKELVRQDELYAEAIDRAEKAEAREAALALRVKAAESKIYRCQQIVNGPMRPYVETLRLLRVELASKEPK